MRTTLTLDPDVERLVRDAMHQQRRGMKHVVNDAIRRALGPTVSNRKPYRVQVHRSELAPALDLAGFNRLADEVEDEVVSERLRS